ncbi:hypothetical protein INT45_001071 [Circinella minor]|uniref:Uncharacterized protein n=1 Tax=Circinella minor TaxID=1195481 RepID=A0A8H7SAI0_9FUNG|nr:hypothetical protein INT45_001071 [Circinella minor]
MLDRLPLEIVLNIISLVPLTTFNTLYQVLPENIVDEALRIHLSFSLKYPFLNLVSTNLCELSAPRSNVNSWLNNESWIPLYYSKLDIPNRVIWLVPCFTSQQHYFRVEDAYVSHGKLLLRPTLASSATRTKITTNNERRGEGVRRTMSNINNSNNNNNNNWKTEKNKDNKESKATLASLWDIRKQLPPTRAGTFSGASEFTTQSQLCREMTIEQSDCWVDACLLCAAYNNNNNNNSDSNEEDNVITTIIEQKQQQQQQQRRPPRPILPKAYERKVPERERDPKLTSSPACGYFIVEQVGLKIPTFLNMFNHSSL